MRWQPNARGRLEQAAFALYSERGFGQTTVADIADRAGLTERTFFRYFADKREVLFSGADALKELFAHTVADAPPSASPIDAVAAGLQAVAASFAGRREFARERHVIIVANPELQERELIKLAGLGSVVADALRKRGVEEPAASLVAQAGIAVFRVAFQAWIAQTEREDLLPFIEEALDQLRGLVVGT